jgi:hypothetical protein
VDALERRKILETTRVKVMSQAHTHTEPPLSDERRAEPTAYLLLRCGKKAAAKDIVSLPSSSVPAGLRLRASIEDGKVTLFDAARAVGSGGGGGDLKGRVLSGAAWITIDDNGMSTFDVRFTLGKRIEEVTTSADDAADRKARLEQAPDPTDFLLGARVTGVARLGPQGADGEFPFALPVAFEGARRVEKWAKPVLRQRAAAYRDYAKLLAQQCFAKGSITITGQKIVALEFTVHPLRST